MDILRSLFLENDSEISEEAKYGQAQKMTIERYYHNQAKDYRRRYYGHCNTSTDIKEANFFGR